MAAHESDTVRVLDNGSVIIPGIGSNGHPGGMFRKNSPCEEFGGYQQLWTPDFEDAHAEWWLRKAIFASAKRYELRLRVKSDADQGDVRVFLRLNNQEPFYGTTVPIPDTHGEWVTIGPFGLDTDIGGFKDTLFKLVIPKVQGSILCIKDITFAPPGADAAGDYSGPWFASWLEELQANMMTGSVVPPLDDGGKESLVGTATEMRAAMTAERRGDLDEQAKTQAQEAVQRAMQDCITAATPILEGMDGTLDDLVGGLDNNKELLQWLVLVQAKPTKLGSYCHEATDDQVRKLIRLLKEDTDLLRKMIVSGGAKGGCYGEALDIYHEIQDSMNKEYAVLPKLQLAIALELCKPLAIFDTVVPVDPVKRYFDYEQAYLEGDLDPAIEQFTVWELRMVVDSDASNEELVWGRKMLYTYRPDMAYMDDQLWRYSSIVKTDVKYVKPDWTRSPRDMVQAVARGGHCGPRAFFGRFINKAFGNPTWGVLQPGHAALSKWTPTGWFCCLGGDLGTCEGRDFEDFKHEVYVRKKFGDETYFCKVELLESVGTALGEDPTDKRTNNIDSHPHAEAPWHTLALLQRKRLGDTGVCLPPTEVTGCDMLTKITQMQQREEPDKEEITVESDGTIVIPSSARDSDRSVIFAKSLEKGRQFCAEEGWWINYKIPAEMVPERKKYKLTMRIASLHDNNLSPFQWIVKSVHHKEQPLKEYVVPHPYTRGLWEETEPVEIELGGGEEELKLMRQKPCWPITVKDFKLTPA